MLVLKCLDGAALRTKIPAFCGPASCFLRTIAVFDAFQGFLPKHRTKTKKRHQSQRKAEISKARKANPKQCHAKRLQITEAPKTTEKDMPHNAQEGTKRKKPGNQKPKPQKPRKERKIQDMKIRLAM